MSNFIDKTTGWRKSSYSTGGNGNCVETKVTRDSALVRDTKHREGGHLAFNPVDWSAFAFDVKAGRWDR